jgi:hypothetical protein
MEKRRSLINIGLVISMLVGAYATLTILNTRPAHAFIFSDPSGDTDGPDITQMEYDVVNDALELKLTFVQKLAGDVINQDLLASIHIDIDKSLMTGFIGGGGLQSQFGMDYEIEIELLGFGPSSNTATLKYWRYKLEEPFIKLDRVSVPLGNLFYPNGSIFVAGYNENYGTDNHQIFMSIPVTLFANTTFPICTDVMELCINQIFPCPLPLTPNLNNAYINLSVISCYFFPGIDLLPDNGGIDIQNATIIGDYPTGPEDMVASVSDPDDDCLAPPGLNGEEITALTAYCHKDGNLTLETKLKSYSLEDTAYYEVYLDIDNNPLTGVPISNGDTILGVELVAKYANFDNPIGEPNPLEGTLKFYLNGEFCPLLYTDYLANVWRSEPGYVWITIPQEFMNYYLSANITGYISVIAKSFNPPVEVPVDIVPNGGVLEIPLYPISYSGDFDKDGDVDGSDLATFAAGGAGISLENFAADFGRTNCPN